MQPLTIDEHLRLALSQVHPEVARFSRALFAVDGRGRPDLHASCVVIECDGTPILVTAAHAISRIGACGSAVHLGARSITPLLPTFVLSSKYGYDPIDIAATICPAELLASEGLEILPLCRTTLGRYFPSFHFRCIHGYPRTKNKQNKRVNVSTKTFATYGFTYAGASRDLQVDYSAFDKDPAVHVALQYQHLGRDETGEIREPPHPRGISGGGLWLVPDSHSTAAPYLEGIAIAYRESDSLVFATRIDQVISFIRQVFLSGGQGAPSY